MSICVVCGHVEEATPGTQTHINVYNPHTNTSDYIMCATCNDDDSLFTFDNGDSRYPTAFALEQRVYYDGESSTHRARPLDLFMDDTSGDVFHCDHCSNDFYGSYTYINDIEENWCTYCTDNNACWDENSEEYYLSSNNFPECPERPAPSFPRRAGFREYLGEASTRFLAAPTVGIEFEHAPVQYQAASTGSDSLINAVQSGRMSEDVAWADLFMMHHDGSIAGRSNYCSSEIVSMPTSGQILDNVITQFYKPFADGRFTPGPEHHSCGFHMHVASKFLMRIKAVGGDDGDKKTRKLAMDLMEDITRICREFVSSSRKTSTYCSGSPKVRDKGMGCEGSSCMVAIFGCGGYPAVAIRTLGTLEYRIWPSSNRIRNTKARAELSQKLTVLFDSCLINEEGLFEMNKKPAAKLHDIAELCVGGERIKVVQALAELLGLSHETADDLMKISSRFNPYSYKKTTFKFTEYQTRAIKNENSTHSSDFIRPSTGEIQHIGDSTATLTSADGNREGFLTFAGCAQCYPAAIEGTMPSLVARLAKGEI